MLKKVKVAAICCLFLLAFIRQADGQLTPLNPLCSAPVTTELSPQSQMAANWSINEVYVTTSATIQVLNPLTCVPTRTLQLPTDAEISAFIKQLNKSVNPPEGPYGPLGIDVSSAGLIALSYSSIGLGQTLSFEGSLDGIVVILDPATDSYRLLDAGVNLIAAGVKFSLDGNTLFVGSSGVQGKSIGIIDVASGKVLQSLTLQSDILNLVALPNGKVYGAGRSGVSVINPDGTGKTLNLQAQVSFLYRAAALGSSGNTVYVSGSDTVAINGQTDQVIQTFPWGGSIFACLQAEPFCYIGFLGSGDLDARNMAQNQLISYTTQQEPSYGLIAGQVAPAQDIIVVLQNGSLQVLKATEPPMVYSVVNAASYQLEAFDPGQILTIFGSNLTDQPNQNAASVPLPTTLSGLQVLTNGAPSPLFYGSTGQINFQLPVNATNPAEIIVVGPQGSTLPITVSVDGFAPALFAWGTGLPIVQHQQNGNAVNSSVSINGEVITLYATGVGSVSPSVPTGQAARVEPNLSMITTPFSITIGGVNCPIQFAGLAPGLVGVDQLNVQVPPNLPAGQQELDILTADGSVAYKNFVTVQ